MSYDIYSSSSDKLLLLVKEVWESEASMNEWFLENVHAELDRTTRAHLLVRKVVDTALERAGMNSGSILDVDRVATVLALKDKLNDFNLFSQLLLNLKIGTPSFDDAKMKSDFSNLEEVYKDKEDSPFAKKAKFKEEGGLEYNKGLALIRNYKILSTMQRGANSYRVSQIGKTPSLVDTNRLSTLSVSSLSQYLTSSKLYLTDIEAVLRHIHYNYTPGGAAADGLSFSIFSDNHGEIMDKALAARFLVSMLLPDSNILSVVPRYESLIITGNSSTLEDMLEKGWLAEYHEP